MTSENLSAFIRFIFQDMDAYWQGNYYSKGELYEKFLKLSNVLYYVLNPLHQKDFKTFFESVRIDTDNMWRLLDSHARKMLQEFSNIQLVFMYVCSFAYSLLKFCERESYNSSGCKQSIMQYVTVDFISLLYARMPALHDLSSLQNLPQIIDFINICYSSKEKLLTFVRIPIKVSEYSFEEYLSWRAYGIPTEGALALYRDNLSEYKMFIYTSFEDDFKNAPDIERSLSCSFFNMDLALRPLYNV